MPGAPLPPGQPTDDPPGEWIEEGIASWYGNPFHGRQTASGERYDMEAPTAAHQSLPFGTIVEVYNLENGRRTHLRINDRGPFVGGRIIDVSRRGARDLEMLGPGTARVRIAIVESPEPERCWEVQAGSFESAANADALRRELDEAGIRARVESSGQGALHRVIIGPFDDRNRAHGMADRVAGLARACR